MPLVANLWLASLSEDRIQQHNRHRFRPAPPRQVEEEEQAAHRPKGQQAHQPKVHRPKGQRAPMVLRPPPAAEDVVVVAVVVVVVVVVVVLVPPVQWQCLRARFWALK